MKIGLSYTGSEEKQQNYVNWLGGGGTIEIVSLNPTHHQALHLDHCDALVLSGGIDIFPGLYQTPIFNYPHAPKRFHPNRDQFEVSLLMRALQTNKPILGICRGFQLINCVFKGSLRLDLGEAQNLIHKATVSNGVQVDKLHAIEVDSTSLLFQILQSNQLAVNSAHHQGIHQLGAGLKVNCRALNGLPEGFEWQDPKGKPAMLAVQWHPERLFQFNLESSPASKNIRNWFVTTILKSISEK